MAFVILLNAIAGIIVTLLYYPDSPLYIFHHVQLEEVWLWAKYSAFTSALLLIFALLSVDTDFRGRDLARVLTVFVATLQGLLNAPPAIIYIIFLHGSSVARIAAGGSAITISSREFFIHLAVIVISWATAVWLAHGDKKRKPSDAMYMADVQV